MLEAVHIVVSDEGYQKFLLLIVDTLGSVNQWMRATKDTYRLPALMRFHAWIGG